MKKPNQKKNSFSSQPASSIGGDLSLVFLTGKVGKKKRQQTLPTTQIILQSFLAGVTFHKTNHLPYSESYIDVVKCILP